VTGSHLVIEPLGQQHDRAAFSCGVAELDRYLREQAGQDVRRSATAVWVLHDTRASSVAGYYTLSAFSIEFASLASDLARRLPRYPILPAILLGRLAVDLRYRGQRLGEVLLFDALRRALDLTRQLGAVAVVVDAKGEAARAFYERYDFTRMKDQEFRLYILMATVVEMFEE
jgi:GNAT superfamily N-acetyltransferase